MKRAALLFVLLLLVSAFAASAEGSFTYYHMTDGTVRVTGYSGSCGNLVVPERLGGYPVSSIAEFAFEGNGTLTSLILPATLTDIGTAAFRSCKNLTRVEIASGASLTIGTYAFYGCCSLESVAFTALHDLTVYGSAFENDVSLSEFLLPDTLTALRIPSNAFAGDDMLSFDPARFTPVSRDMTVAMSAFTYSYNHIGYTWTQEYFVNGEKKNPYARVTLKVGDEVTVSAVITEHDKKPDTGEASASHIVTAEDLARGFSMEFSVDVAENSGRYSGYVSTWKVTFKFL